MTAVSIANGGTAGAAEAVTNDGVSRETAGTGGSAYARSAGSADAQRLIATVEQVVHGRHGIVGLATGVVLAGGHLLIEDVPGSGKTTLARAMSAGLGGTFRRIQGTSDLMASDITGSSVWDPDTRRFEFVPGPIFANVVLVDELNRTPPRTQSALLEAMDEGAVTVDGVRHPLPEPFVLLATQNPFDQWGTYPLPEGQLDRFAALLSLGQNSPEVERQVLREQLAGPTVETLQPAVTAERLGEMRKAVTEVHVADSVLDYAIALTTATRRHPSVAIGASTRAGLSLVRCAQAMAYLADTAHVTPDIIKQLAAPVLAHRVVMRSQDAGRADAARLLADLVGTTPVPPYSG